MTFFNMNYSEARRRARSLLGDNAEVQELKNAPVYKFVIGVRLKGQFIPMGAGGTWSEALDDAKKRPTGVA